MSQFMSLADAVEANIRDGDAIAMEGFTHLIRTLPATRWSASGASG
jgi:acyl CoA:acetate/3-ketoacid CoA transferase alpha subunit